VPQFAYKPCPQYPYVARRQGLEGVVLLRVQMLANGTVGEVEIVTSSGHSALDNAALRAVKKWTAIPMRNGTQASHWANVPVNFRLQRAAGADGAGTAATLAHLNCDP
jgi:protein TonB